MLRTRTWRHVQMHFETKAGCARTWFGPIKRESYRGDGQGGVVDATRAWRRKREATPGSAGRGKGGQGGRRVGEEDRDSELPLGKREYLRATPGR